MANKILLLDSNSLMHRAYHALPNLKTSKGQYTGAIFGFLNILLKLINEQNPTHVAAAFDLHGPTFRHELYGAYKATRKPMDEELREQVEPLKEIITLMGIKIVSMQGYEGDDILGTLSNRFSDECIIVTGDRDSFQLVSPTTKIFWTKKGVTDIEVYDEKRLLSDGFTVSQFIDFKALRGDPSDNIPGVSGVGEKTAKQLLDDYGSLDGVLAHAHEIKGKLGQTLMESKDIALLSRELAIINKNVPVDIKLEELAFTPVYSAALKKKLTELEISSLANRMTFENEPKQTLDKTVIELATPEALEKTEFGDTVALLISDEIRIADSKDKEYLIKCSDDLFGGFGFDEAIELVKKKIAGRTLVAYDIKSMIRSYGFEVDKYFDIMIAAHLARDSAPIKSIEQALGADGLEVGACELLIEREGLMKVLTEKGLDRLFFDVEQPLMLVLSKMEARGVCVSVEVLKTLEQKYGALIKQCESKIFELAGRTFNIASPKQLGEILFDELKLASSKATKNGYSVSDDVLETLMGAHPIIPLIREYRHYSKLQSTYVVGFQPLIKRGRIHTVYNQCITMTGRLSSTNPNLQNLPARSEEAKDVKSAFLPSSGNVLVSADYSQIELRLLAHMSGDEELIRAFNNNEDIHARTAASILDIPIDKVTPEQRRDAKAVNFGIIYGISGFGLAENLSIPRWKAKEFIDNYFLSHPKVREYMDNCVKEAKERGYSLTMLSRRRNLSDLGASNFAVRSAAERMAMNTPLQGSAADIIKLAMLGVERRLEGKKSKMILQIHDELIIDAAPDEVEEVKKLLSEEMEHAVELRVPLVAEATSAKNWAELK